MFGYDFFSSRQSNRVAMLDRRFVGEHMVCDVVGNVPPATRRNVQTLDLQFSLFEGAEAGGEESVVFLAELLQAKVNPGEQW